MRSLHIVLVFTVVSSVVANSKWRSYISQLCEGQFKYWEIINLVRGYHSGRLLDDCRHSFGFHFNPEICPTEKTTISFSAFLSEDNYLYIYVPMDKLIVKEYNDQNPQVINLKWGLQKLQGWNWWPKELTSLLFVLWIKEEVRNRSSLSFRVGYDDNSKAVRWLTGNLSTRADQQLLLKDLSSDEIKITFSSGAPLIRMKNIWVEDSYYIFCGKQAKFASDKCRPVEENERISCHCGTDPTYLIIILVLLFWGCAGLIVIRPAMDKMADGDKTDRTSFPIFHNCNERNHKYKYLLILRFAKPGADYDLKNVTIDIEFFTKNNESVAPNFRFRAKVLQRQPVTNIKIIMWRLTKMPELKLIQCSHSGDSEAKICLLGILNRDIEGERIDTIDIYRIMKNICRTPRRFNLQKLPLEQEVLDAEVRPMKNLVLMKISISLLEFIYVMIVDICFIAVFTTAIQLNSIHSVFIRMLSLIVLTTIFAIGFNTAFLLTYKYLLLLEMKQQIEMHSRYERLYSILILVFLGTFFLISFGMTGYILIERLNDTFVVLLGWVAVILCSTGLMALVWNIYNHWDTLFPAARKMSEESSMTVNSASVNEPFL